MKRKQFGYSLILISLLLQAFIMGSSLAQSSQSTMYIMGGVYPGAPSYTVWVEGSNYFAKDAYGQIDYSGTNGTEIIQSVFDVVDGNGKIYFKAGIYEILGVHLTITYTVTDSTQQYVEVYGDGMGETIFKGIITASGVSSSNTTETDQAAWFMIEPYTISGIRVYFHDFQIDGQHDSQTHIVSGIVLRHPRDSIIQRLFIHRCSRNGISITGANLAYRATVIRDNQIFDINDPDGTPPEPYSIYCNGINMEYGFADLYVFNNEIGWIGYVTDEGGAVGNGITASDSDIVEANIIWVVGRGVNTWWDVKDVIIRNNFVDYAYNASIHIDHANMTSVLNNVIRMPYQYGIYISNSSFCSIQNNKLNLREGYSCNWFIFEGSPDSDYNSISFNNAWTEGTITVAAIETHGAHTTTDHNVGSP